MKRKRSGATILEIALIIAIVGVFALLLLPAILRQHAQSTQPSRGHMVTGLTSEQVGDNMFVVRFNPSDNEPRTITYIEQALKMWQKDHPLLAVTDVEMISTEGRDKVYTGMILITRNKE